MADTIEYRGTRYAPEEFERQFNPRAAVPDVDAIQERRARLSEEARGRLGGVLDVRYGPGERQVMDVFPAPAPGGPVFVFFHGGYWREGSARANSFVAEPFAAAGAAAFIVTYDLCPAVTVADIAQQAREALAWIRANAGEYGGDPKRMYACGHSAGAHLVALALAHDWPGEDGTSGNPVKGACLVSGIYDLAPVLDISVNARIGLRAADVAPLSPLGRPPRAPVPVIVAAGGAEPREWVRQSRLYAEVCRTAGCPVETIEVPGADHYSALLGLPDPADPLRRAMLAMMGL